ncbi:hypothetical protein RRG08_004780 [Elysia crispata]|uniref:Uncharacterized protein n=1 Tax=Elysia crispata TaxID=231223 RepID=A0AAE1AJ74_9GAST|nr:hypothetical protein RRG08_004780 [Elysia crispata]
MADIQEELGTAPGSLDGRQGEITELGWVEGRSGQSKYRFTVTCPRVTPEAESLVSGGMLRWILFSRAICIFMKFCFNPGLGLKGNTVSSWAELCQCESQEVKATRGLTDPSIPDHNGLLLARRLTQASFILQLQSPLYSVRAVISRFWDSLSPSQSALDAS